MNHIGKELRLSRLFRSGRTLLVAMDHGPTFGPVKGIRDFRATIEQVAKAKPDCVMMYRGLVRVAAPYLAEHDVPFILKLTASTIWGQTPTVDAVTDDVAEAARMGASGVSMRLLLGSSSEREVVSTCGRFAREADNWGLPFLVMAYPCNVENVTDVGVVEHAARFAAELGADVVKTYYTGSATSFSKVVESCPVPVVMKGGDKAKDDRSYLEVLDSVLKAGAAGAAVGRNIWQHERPGNVIAAIMAMFHQNASVDEAYRILTS